MSQVVHRTLTAFVLLCAVALAGACAGPPLTLYTLEPADGATQAASASGRTTSGRLKVVEVRRVIVPDQLDNQDILVRDGSTLVRSSQGRWATRLSLGATQFVTAELARREPNILITDQPQVEAPDYRLFLTISRLDVTADGSGTLEADWLIVPRNPASRSRRQRGRFTATGPVATDQDVVALNTALLRQLSDAVAASAPW